MLLLVSCSACSSSPLPWLCHGILFQPLSCPYDPDQPVIFSMVLFLDVFFQPKKMVMSTSSSIGGSFFQPKNIIGLPWSPLGDVFLQVQQLKNLLNLFLLISWVIVHIIVLVVSIFVLVIIVQVVGCGDPEPKALTPRCPKIPQCPGMLCWQIKSYTSIPKIVFWTVLCLHLLPLMRWRWGQGTGRAAIALFSLVSLNTTGTQLLFIFSSPSFHIAH